MRILLLGNSQIVSFGNVPDLITKLSRSAAPQCLLEAEVVAIGGASIEQLWTDGRPIAAIRGGGWDWVLCHELVYSYGGNGDRLREFGRRFHREAQSVGARMLFYASGDVEGQRGTHEPMYRDAAELARECGGRVAGGGSAWLRAWREQPDLDFHCPDRAHAGHRGYYLNACVIFAALTNRSPIGLDPCTVSAPEASFLQRIAWDQYHEDRRSERAVAMGGT
ncbi:MAG: hypothetical protein H0W83_00290 [Planctomycetes bacterium]|nr:hypothetical protein [Planctomycetota bacterium]